MPRYSIAYRLGLAPWEHHERAARASIGTLLDREVAERPSPPGRVIDLGCGRGRYAPALVERSWEVVGVDNVRRAVEAALGGWKMRSVEAADTAGPGLAADHDVAPVVTAATAGLNDEGPRPRIGTRTFV